MRFSAFRIENFKGIEKMEINLPSQGENSIYSLVGLNESGKTTILEAINYFIYKNESLDALDLDRYQITDIHELVPIHKRDNFNGFIKIQAELTLDEDDRYTIKEKLLEELINFKEVFIPDKVSFTQRYCFENSKHNDSKDERLWTHGFEGVKKRSSKKKDLTNDEALKVNEFIKDKIPNILYFPNFLFEFPERIYLEEKENPKYVFYQKIISDVLDSLNNDLDIDDHLILRMKSKDPTDKRNLNSVLNKMNRKLTEVIFSAWNSIFSKNIDNKEIKLEYGVDNDKGAYIEFYIQDNIDTYRINERSLGFRWFFVFLLLTQFRSFGNNRRSIFLLDEPASNLHPSAQSQLLQSFKKLNRVIYTTHSHYMINPAWLENTFVVKNDAIDYKNEENFNIKQTNIKIFPYKKFAVEFPNQETYYQPILEVLDYKPSDLDLIPFGVLLEGKSDFYFYRYFQDVLSNDDYEFRFIPGTGSGNLDSIISLFLGWGKRFIVLLDSDKEGKKQKERYLDNYGLILEEHLVSYDDIDIEWSNFGLEKLLEKEDKMNILKCVFPESKKFSKKNFNRAIQEILVNEQKIELNSLSMNRIKKVVSYISSMI